MQAIQPTRQENETTLARTMAKVLVATGDLLAAEKIVQNLMDADSADLTSLNLFSKIKHIKGELSQAIGCWAQLHLQSPHNESARMYLLSILNLARNPERNVGQFVAMGNAVGPKRPTIHLELETAFRSFLGGQVDKAQAHCRGLADRFEAHDQQAYKFARMAEALVAELSGHLGAAAKTLEDLGSKSGLETDVDRVLSLARIYEMMNGREQLEAAANICKYLIRSYAKMSALSRLSGLYRRLGEEDQASFYERKFLDTFTQRMFVPNLDEIAWAGTQRYIPLTSLLSIRPSDHEEEGIPCDDRSLALRMVLTDQRTEASRRWESCEEPDDRRYLADLLYLEGEYDSANQVYADLLKQDPTDLASLKQAMAAASDKGEFFRRHFSEGDRRKKCQTAIVDQLETAPLSAELWEARWLLAELEGADSGEVGEFRRRVETSREANDRRQRTVGRTLAAAVYSFTGKKKGLVHEVWSERSPAEEGLGGNLFERDILGNLTRESRSTIRNIFFATREYARARFPHRVHDIMNFNYMFKVTKEDEASGGLSIGLPTAVSFLSVFLQEPVPQNIAMSGTIITDSHQSLSVKRIGDAEFKVKGAYHRDLKTLILPKENEPEFERPFEVPRAISQSLTRFVDNLDEVIEICFGRLDS